MAPPRILRQARRRILRALDALSGYVAVGVLRLLRLTPRKASANVAAAAARRIGPLLKEHRIGRANLAAAFPEKSPQEIENILSGVWDNLGRVAAEFAHLDRVVTYDPDVPGLTRDGADIEYDEATKRRFDALRANKQPVLIFACHMANWELPAQVARHFGLDTAIMFRRPNVGAVADAIVAIREASMGQLVPSGLNAPIILAEALRRNRAVAMLVDQYARFGVDVTFFGQRTKANPLIARLARQIDCPIYGTRTIRLPDGRFRAELSEEVKAVRDADGAVDIAGTMQAITNVIEGWVREHPEQWLWLHRRWRPEDFTA